MGFQRLEVTHPWVEQSVQFGHTETDECRLPDRRFPSPTGNPPPPRKTPHRGVYFLTAWGYPACMETLPIPRTAGLIVATSTHGLREQAAQLASELVLHGPVTVLDGGNCFPFYRFARLVRAGTDESAAATGRLFVRRAFTCYQMLALLESTPSLPQPYLVLDLLSTFEDEQVPAWEASRLTDACLAQAKRLCLHAPVILLLASPRHSERAHLLERICLQADQTFALEEPVPTLLQPSLF